jgi:hypothetical protein
MKEVHLSSEQLRAGFIKLIEEYTSMRDDFLIDQGFWKAAVMRVAGISPEWERFMDSIPSKQWPNHLDGGEGMKEWEAEAYEHGAKLIFARKMKPYLQSEELEAFFVEHFGDPVKGKLATMAMRDISTRFVRESAIAIGSIVEKQVFMGNYNALNIIGDGLSNLAEGRNFKPQAGQKKSGRRLQVVFAFNALKQKGIGNPSQDEVRKFLAAQGDPISKGMISRLFDELGLKDEGSDAREALSQAGKRKRKRT